MSEAEASGSHVWRLPDKEPSGATLTTARPPRAAATLVVVRDSDAGLEVLLSRRAERGDLASGAWVFPGGMLDPGDRVSHPCCVGLDDAEASRRLGLEQGGLDYYVAAVRECFEESGLLYAADAKGSMVRLDDHAIDANGERIDAWRGPLHRGERALGDLCGATGLKLAVDRLIYLSHWLTPVGRAKRFDTRFFLAEVPLAQTAAHDGTEMLEQLWIRPDEALARGAELKLMTPTQKTLETLARFANVASLLEWARAPRRVAMVMPRIGVGAQGMRPVLPSEPAWAEIGRLDPAGHGRSSYDLVPGVAVCLSERVIRVTAGNGNMMTGPGTNTYLVGGGESNEWAVIDPGPLDASHVDAIVAAAPGPIRWIFATHTHSDHSPAVRPLRERTGAQVYGQAARHREWQDATFIPDVALEGDEQIVLPGPRGEASTLRVLHTPGHAANHLCYLLEEEKLLFTGDHVMQASTVVINPPDGDMAAYIASLKSLAQLDLEWLAPGHGFLMAEPRGAMEAIVEHRLRREAKVIDALRHSGPAGVAALVPSVYADVPERLHAMAARSLQAHLLKLRSDGAAVEEQGLWRLVGAS